MLGLGWAPGLSLGDGPVAGLRTFWKVPSLVSVGVAASVGALVVVPAVVRLCGHLWTVPGGPRRGRRLGVALLHGWVPWGVWIAVTLALGWPLSELSLAGVVVVGLGCLTGALVLTPRAVAHPRHAVSLAVLILVALPGVVTSSALIWAGTPRADRPLAVVWGEPELTNNIRPEWRVVKVWRGGPPKP